VATPHGLDFEHAAKLYGCGHVRVADEHDLRVAVEGALGAARTTIIEVRTDRAENLELHRRLADAVLAALR
jgi:2-succinyl-5-enolpyruvyl-6-hydroxy-3-cyclohexene-1-carboxylate synthase